MADNGTKGVLVCAVKLLAPHKFWQVCTENYYVTTKTRLYFVRVRVPELKDPSKTRGLLCTEAGASAGSTGANRCERRS